MFAYKNRYIKRLIVILSLTAITVLTLFFYKSKPSSDLYAEKYRQQLHYSCPEAWVSDPNGLIYYEGEYHLFYQNNLNPEVWSMSWGHAVSKDLITWETLPIVMSPDEMGEIWSGSCVADVNNTSGFFDENGGIVAIYSYSTNQIAIAYSSDKGRTFTKYEGNPVIPNPGTKDFRDPKVFWYEPEGKWIMIVAGGMVRIYSSNDLINWKFESSNNDIYTECPDLFPLSVDGEESNVKWVLTLAGRSAYIGTFDGHEFYPETQEIILNSGPDSYAGQTFSNLNDRVIMVNWMNSWMYAEDTADGKWIGSMNLFNELTLKKNGDGQIILCQNPIDEYESLRKKAIFNVNDVVLAPGENPLDDCKEIVYEVDSKIDVSNGADFEFNLRSGNNEKIVIGYDAENKIIYADRQNAMGNYEMENNYFTASVLGVGNIIDMRIFVDTSCVEIYVNDVALISMRAWPFTSSCGMSLTGTKDLNIKNLMVYPLKSIWDVNRDGPVTIHLETHKNKINLKKTIEIPFALFPMGDVSDVEIEVSGDCFDVSIASGNILKITGVNAGEGIITLKSNKYNIEISETFQCENSKYYGG